MMSMRNALKVVSDFLDILGVITLISFTLIMLSMAMASKGVYIYYYEPNKAVWIAEMILAVFGITVGWKIVINYFFQK